MKPEKVPQPNLDIQSIESTDYSTPEGEDSFIQSKFEAILNVRDLLAQHNVVDFEPVKDSETGLIKSIKIWARATGKEIFVSEDPKEIELLFRVADVNFEDVENLNIKDIQEG